MNRKFTKKALAMLLSLILTLVPVFTLCASAAVKTVPCPTVTVSGFMSNPIYADPADPDSEVIWPLKSEQIVATVEKAIPALSEVAVTHNWDKFTDSVMPLAYDLLSPVFVNERGELAGTATVRAPKPDPYTLKTQNRARFVYDWRLDPFDSAAKLDTFIDEVLAITGAEKVNIDCHSLGGVITLTYATVYGNSKVNTYILHSTALYGISYTGELLNGNIVLSGDSLRCCLNFAMRNHEYAEAIKGISYMLASAGLLDFVASAGNYLVEKIAGKVLPGVVAPMFGRWPTIWAMSSDADVESGIEYMFTEMVEDNADSRILRAKIERYNSEVRANREQTLRKMDEECKVGVIAKYGFAGLPFTPAWNLSSDGTIDVGHASFGAKASLVEQTLPKEHIDKVDPQFISPDKTVDASTALFPDKTWYIKEMEHSQMNADLDELIYKMAYSEEELTVNSDPKFPRFMKYDRLTDKLVPDEVQGKEKITSFWQLFERYWKFVYSIIVKIKNLFRS